MDVLLRILTWEKQSIRFWMTWSIINEKQYFPVACLVDLPDYALLLQKNKTKKKQRAGLGLEIPVMYQAK